MTDVTAEVGAEPSGGQAPKRKVSSYRRKKRGTVRRKKKATTPRWEPDFRGPSSRTFAHTGDILRPIRGNGKKYVARGDGLTHADAVRVMTATLRDRWPHNRIF